MNLGELVMVYDKMGKDLNMIDEMKKVRKLINVILDKTTEAYEKHEPTVEVDK